MIMKIMNHVKKLAALSLVIATAVAITPKQCFAAKSVFKHIKWCDETDVKSERVEDKYGALRYVVHTVTIPEGGLGTEVEVNCKCEVNEAACIKGYAVVENQETVSGGGAWNDPIWCKAASDDAGNANFIAEATGWQFETDKELGQIQKNHFTVSGAHGEQLRVRLVLPTLVPGTPNQKIGWTIEVCTTGPMTTAQRGADKFRYAEDRSLQYRIKERLICC
jgi:hypothetical protein